MNAFIDNIKSELQLISNDHKLLLVLGNESCDLDSAVSSIIYAYYLNWRNKQSNQNNIVCIPVLNIPKEELPLKTEVMYALKKFGVDLTNLICNDDLNIISLPDKYDLEVVLVDHHIIGNTLQCLVPFVSTILDHRPKDESGWNYKDDVKANIVIVGSCSTLVCSEIINDINENFLRDNRDVANLLISTIILDTANFSSSADRARPLDFKMAEALENILEADNPELRSTVFNELLKARIDCSSLNSLQLLHRDLKIIDNFPIPGTPMLVKDYLKREDCYGSMEEFCRQKNAKTIIIVGLAVVNDEVLRDLAVFSLEPSELHEKVVKALLDETEPCLDLVKTPVGENSCEHFTQNNVKASRKQIVPIVRKLLSS